jgi:hypothetical protein
MEVATNPIHGAVENAIRGGTALTAGDIRALREKSSRAITAFKAVFWIALAVFNLLIWVELPIARSLLVALLILAPGVGIIVPMLGIRRQQGLLALLEDASSAPKERRADEPARAYIGQVRKEGRRFVKAEAQVLEEKRNSAAS